MKKLKLLLMGPLVASVIFSAPMLTLAAEKNNQGDNKDNKVKVELKAEQKVDNKDGDDKVSKDKPASKDQPVNKDKPLVVTNRPPEISGVTAPTLLKVGETGTWTVKAKDPEDGSLSYAVDWGEASIMKPLAKLFGLQAFVQTSTFTHAYMSAGDYTITFTVTDDGGKTTTSTVTVHVKGKVATAPLISNPSAVAKNKHSGTASWTTDVKADSMVWISDTTPVDTSGTPDVSRVANVLKHKINLNGLDPGTTYYVVVGSTNKGGTTMSTEMSFTTPGKNQKNAPVINSLSGPSTVEAGETETVTINATDPKNSSLTYSADWGDSSSTMSSLAKMSQVFSQTATLSHVYENEGTYTAVFTVENTAGKKASASMDITVTAPSDTTAPVIAPHADVTAMATSSAGAIVTYTSPDVTDDVDATTTADCVPASGSTFPIGTTAVLCDHTDSSGNAAVQTSFNVIVSDTTIPVIAAHLDMTVEATSSAGAVVTYTSPDVTDDVDATTTATCLPASGSAFPMGATTVLCNHTDSSGNVAVQTSFIVTVVDSTTPVISNVNMTVGSTTNTITWDTDEAATSAVFYSLNTPVDITSSSTPVVSDTMLLQNHSISLTGLTANTLYYFIIRSVDPSSNAITTSEATFTTNP